MDRSPLVLLPHAKVSSCCLVAQQRKIHFLCVFVCVCVCVWFFFASCPVSPPGVDYPSTRPALTHVCQLINLINLIIIIIIFVIPF
jgi:hypothetical protein